MDGAGDLARPFPVDDPHFKNPALATAPQVFRHQAAQFRGPERMQIQLAGDGQFNRLIAFGWIHPGSVATRWTLAKDDDIGNLRRPP